VGIQPVHSGIGLKVSAMTVYCVYVLDERQTKRVRHMLDCAGDDTAIKHAQQFAGRYGLELWDRDRLVALIGADRGKPKL
jgi:hypothetical protein